MSTVAGPEVAILLSERLKSSAYKHMYIYIYNTNRKDTSDVVLIYIPSYIFRPLMWSFQGVIKNGVLKMIQRKMLKF